MRRQFIQSKARDRAEDEQPDMGSRGSDEPDMVMEPEYVVPIDWGEQRPGSLCPCVAATDPARVVPCVTVNDSLVIFNSVQPVQGQQ